MGRPAKTALERIEITRGDHAFIRGRVDFLATWPMTDRSLMNLLANAYLLGLIEAAEVMAERTAS